MAPPPRERARRLAENTTKRDLVRTRVAFDGCARRRVDLWLTAEEGEALDRVIAERGTHASEVLRAGLQVLDGQPVAPVTGAEIVALATAR